ncbi:tRNA 2-thiocytidine(32) synthetase TtcA, partial [Pseudomonas aeruginosa]|nr:tRNA 2-thiocytidine(32) synthetase TtcA [Pseudomonas aeruginosa]
MMMGEQVSQINKAAELRRKKLRGNVGKAVVD